MEGLARIIASIHVLVVVAVVVLAIAAATVWGHVKVGVMEVLEFLTLGVNKCKEI